MKKIIFFFLVSCFTALQATWLSAQTSTGTTSSTTGSKNKNKELRLNLNDDGSHFVKATVLNQVWVRYNQNNPGSTVYGEAEASTFDIGLRRTRIQLFGQITDRVFFYAQFGQNSFNYLSARKTGAFFHDVVGEYKVHSDILSIGAGLTGWTGVGRYSSPSVGTILGMDAPLYQQYNNDVNDQFLRKLSIYAKGKTGKLDYRLALSKPFAIQTASVAVAPLSTNSTFSTQPPKLQYQGYLMYQFLDKESNLIPYTTGSYLGQKRVFNIGGGFAYQPTAMWYKNSSNDTIQTAMAIFSVDVFYDAPLNADKGTAIAAYASFMSADYGPNYVRNFGVMNPTNGVNASGTFNGTGNAFPLIGTGDIFYAQVGYLLPKNLLGENNGALQPYIEITHGNYKRLQDPVNTWNVGVNWLISGHTSKITFNYQNRPIFNTDASTGDIVKVSRKGMYVVQYQIFC